MTMTGNCLVDQRDRPMFQLAGCIALGVDVADFLELQRAFERQRIGRAATEIKHVCRLAELVRQRLDAGLQLHRLGQKARHHHQLVDQAFFRLRDPARRARAPAPLPARPARQLAGEGLGRRDADFWPRQRRRGDIGFRARWSRSEH